MTLVGLGHTRWELVLFFWGGAICRDKTMEKERDIVEREG